MAKSKSTDSKLYAFLVVQPLIFLFLTIFVFRSDVRWFFGLAIAMLISLAILSRKIDSSRQKILALVLVALASIGLAASCILTIEKIELLKNPAHVTSCSFSPIVACSPVIGSAQASAIDSMPNPIFGVFGFACLFTAGFTILAGASKLARAWWLAMFAGVCFGVLFCIWLINAGVYDIGALCLYCFSVWLVTFSLFWVVLSELLVQKHLSFSKKIDKFIIENRNTLITVSIAIVILLLYFRWSDYWNSLL